MSASGNANNIMRKDTFEQPNNVYNHNITNGIPNPSNAQHVPNTFNPQFDNFNKAFQPLPSIPFNGVQPKGMFLNHDFSNNQQLLHNNIFPNVLHEEIREYSILIDSKDRNFQVYRDPFSFRVTFKPLPSQLDPITGIRHESPAPVINDSMCNIRYIKLDNIILPKWYCIKARKQKVLLENGARDEVVLWDVNKKKSLVKNNYIVMVVDELCSNSSNLLSTNDLLSESFATIYFDQSINDTHYQGETTNGYKVFPIDKLYELKYLTFRFLNPYGEKIECGHLDKKILSNFDCKCDFDEDDFDTEWAHFEKPNCHIHNLCHCLNPLFQLHINLRIGVYQPNLNKQRYA